MGEGDRADVVRRVCGVIRDGVTPVVSLVGEPGIGKTTVLTDALGQLTPSWSWRTQCFEVDAELGLSALAALFAAMPDDVITALPDPQRRAVDTVLYRAAPGTTITISDRLLAMTLTNLMVGLLRQGTVCLAVDDVHWCDPTSLTALRHALARISAPSLWLLTTSRTGLQPQLPRGHEVVIGPLDVEATRRLVRSLAPHARDRQIADAAEASGGNPFFAAELARALADGRATELPSSLRAALDRRLDDLPARAQAALLDLAVRGDATTHEIAINDLDTAFTSGVVRVLQGRVQFTHPLLASASVERATPGALRQAHRLAADSADDPVVRALHRSQIEPPGADLAADLDDAVVFARARADWTSFLRLARAAVLATPRGTRSAHRLLQLAQAELIRGDLSAVKPLAEEAARLTTSGVDIVHAAELLDMFIDDHGAGAAAFARLAERSELDDDQRRQARIDQCSRLHKAGRLAEAIDLLTELLPAQRDATWSQLIGNIASIRQLAGEPANEGLLAEAIQIERAWNAEHGSRLPLEDAAGHAGIIAFLDDRHGDARALFGEADRAVMAVGVGPRCHYYMGALMCREGRVGDAIRFLAADYPLGAYGEAQTDALLRLGYCVVWSDHAWTARILAHAKEHLLDNDHRENADALFLEGFDLLLDRRPSEAWPHLRSAVDRLDLCGYREPSRIPARLAGIEAAVDAGDLVPAERMCADLGAASEALNSRWGFAATTRGRGLIAAASGQPDKAEELLAQSAEAFGAIEVPLEAARSYQLLGVLRRRLGHRRDARQALTRARDIGVACEAQRLAIAAEAELARVGGRQTTTPAGLTDAEQQVADLVVDGLRNKDVADALHVSVKTVETHLSRIYRKVGVTNRTALARATMDTRTGRSKE